jgi:hypothetical protein
MSTKNKAIKITKKMHTNNEIISKELAFYGLKFQNYNKIPINKTKNEVSMQPSKASLKKVSMLYIFKLIFYFSILIEML